MAVSAVSLSDSRIAGKRLPNRNPVVIPRSRELAVLSGRPTPFTQEVLDVRLRERLRSAAATCSAAAECSPPPRRSSAARVPRCAAAPATAGKLRLGPDIYQSIGVRPLINCRGTLTVISGSLELPEVRAAVDAGGQHHVVLDELMEGVARRLAELTGAEWALVSSGCAAGMAHTTAACVTGGNPDLHVRIPGPDRLREGRGGDSEGLAQRVRPGDPLGGRAHHRGGRRRGIRSRARSEGGDGLHHVRQPHGERPAQLRRRLQHRQEEEHPGLHRRRGRDADRPEHLPAARLHLRRLQRRQVPARAAVRRPDPRPQRPAAGRLGVERAAPRARPRP